MSLFKELFFTSVELSETKCNLTSLCVRALCQGTALCRWRVLHVVGVRSDDAHATCSASADCSDQISSNTIISYTRRDWGSYSGFFFQARAGRRVTEIAVCFWSLWMTDIDVFVWNFTFCYLSLATCWFVLTHDNLQWMLATVSRLDKVRGLQE